MELNNQIFIGIMCMIAVGIVKEKRGPGVRVSVDGYIREFRSELNLKEGDMVVVSGKRLVKKLEVANGRE